MGGQVERLGRMGKMGGFACACLSIGEDAHVVAIQNGGNHRCSIGKDIRCKSGKGHIRYGTCDHDEIVENTFE